MDGGGLVLRSCLSAKEKGMCSAKAQATGSAVKATGSAVRQPQS